MAALAGLLALVTPQAAWAGETYSLSALEALARESNPALKVAATQVDAAQARIEAARAFPNPEVEYMAGPSRYRPGISGVSGGSSNIGITQPIDLPFRRNPRIAAARAGLEASTANRRAYEADWIANLRQAYFDLLRRDAEKLNTQEDLALMQSVQAKIRLRVEQGDSPRIELIRTEAELLNVQKAAQAAALREEQAALQLRALVGPRLPADFTVSGQLDAPLPLASLDALVEQAITANPALARARAEAEQARYRLNYEEAGRLPSLSLRASREADPELRQTRVGVSLSIPLWDRRQGPVREAEAEVAESRLRLDAETYAIRQNLEIAWRKYEIAQAQVAALEGGLVAQAKAAVAVAETAYRAGERGLIDVLDAQRVYRSARADLITSRYELADAWVEIQQLIAAPESVTPETLAADRSMP